MCVLDEEGRVVKAASIRNERGQLESVARSHPGAAVIITTEPRERLGEIPPERDPQGETSGSERVNRGCAFTHLVETPGTL